MNLDQLQALSKSQLIAHAETIGLKLPKGMRKDHMVITIHNHYAFIELNRKMANRPNRGLLGS